MDSSGNTSSKGKAGRTLGPLSTPGKSMVRKYAILGVHFSCQTDDLSSCLTHPTFKQNNYEDHQSNLIMAFMFMLAYVGPTCIRFFYHIPVSFHEAHIYDEEDAEEEELCL